MQLTTVTSLVTAGRKGEYPPKPKIDLQKRCSFPELYKLTNFLENLRQWLKIKFPVRLSYLIKKIFSKLSNIY